MRLFVLLLLLANLLLWACMEYVVPRGGGDALAQQVNPQRLRLLSSSEIAQMPAASGPACIEFGPLDETNLGLAKEAARALQKNISIAERRTEAGIYLELRAPSDLVRKQIGDLLTGVNAGICPG